MLRFYAILFRFLDEDEYKNSGDDVKILERFFLLMSQYSIYSYDKTGNGDEGDYYRINYRFARLVMETLEGDKQFIFFKGNI